MVSYLHLNGSRDGLFVPYGWSARPDESPCPKVLYQTPRKIHHIRSDTLNTPYPTYRGSHPHTQVSACANITFIKHPEPILKKACHYCMHVCSSIDAFMRRSQSCGRRFPKSRHGRGLVTVDGASSRTTPATPLASTNIRLYLNSIDRPPLVAENPWRMVQLPIRAPMAAKLSPGSVTMLPPAVRVWKARLGHKLWLSLLPILGEKLVVFGVGLVNRSEHFLRVGLVIAAVMPRHVSTFMYAHTHMTDHNRQRHARIREEEGVRRTKRREKRERGGRGVEEADEARARGICRR